MTDSKTGILVAMPQECRSLTSKPIAEGGLLALNDACLVGVSGAGPEAANRCAQRLAEQGGTRLISWGCAAALDPSLKPGDLLIPATIIGADGENLLTDEQWRAEFMEQLNGQIPVNQGALLESRRIVSTAAEKRNLYQQTGALGLDMESAAAARAAKALGLPFLAIRSIVDPADVDIPPSIAAAFDEKGVLHVPKMLMKAVFRPVDLLGIIRLGRDFGKAMETLKAITALIVSKP